MRLKTVAVDLAPMRVPEIRELHPRRTRRSNELTHWYRPPLLVRDRPGGNAKRHPPRPAVAETGDLIGLAPQMHKPAPAGRPRPNMKLKTEKPGLGAGHRISAQYL